MMKKIRGGVSDTDTGDIARAVSYDNGSLLRAGASEPSGCRTFSQDGSNRGEI